MLMGVFITVSEHTSNLVIMPGIWCGRVVVALHEAGVNPDLGKLWRCRSKGQHEDLPELALFALKLRGTEDPDARELLDEAGKKAWDTWHTPPDVDF